MALPADFCGAIRRSLARGEWLDYFGVPYGSVLSDLLDACDLGSITCSPGGRITPVSDEPAAPVSSLWMKMKTRDVAEAVASHSRRLGISTLHARYSLSPREEGRPIALRRAELGSRPSNIRGRGGCLHHSWRRLSMRRRFNATSLGQFEATLIIGVLD